MIDDDPAAAKVIAAALEAAGVDVVTAADGLAGLRVLVDELLYLDLLVTDVVMPALSGVALVRTIRQLGGELELPILAVSGALDAGLAAELRAAGANEVAEKALGPVEIAERAAALLATRRREPTAARARLEAAESGVALGRIALGKAARPR